MCRPSALGSRDGTDSWASTEPPWSEGSGRRRSIHSSRVTPSTTAASGISPPPAIARPNSGTSRIRCGALPPAEPSTSIIRLATSAAVAVSGPRMATVRTAGSRPPSSASFDVRTASCATSCATDSAATGAMRMVGRTATGPRVVICSMRGTSSNHWVEWIRVTGSPEVR